MGTVKEILALHGWTTSIEKWESFSDSCTKKNIRLKIPAIPGLTKKISKPWILSDYVNWLKKQIGTKKIILLGHSNGGRIALSFTAKYPQNVKQLILIDSAGIYHNELPLKMKRLVFNALAKIGKKVIYSDKLKTLLYKLTGESDYKNADQIQKQTMVNLITQDLTPILDKIKVPTLIIWGEKDTITKLSDGKLMQKKIKNSTLEIIHGAKHSPHYTHPKEVVKIICEYI